MGSLAAWPTSKFVLPGLLILVAALYAPTLRAGYVYDDRWFIVNNPALDHPSLRYLFDRSTVAAPASGLTTDVYRPLTTFSWALDRAIGGRGSLLGHLHNLVLHLLNIILVFVVMRRVLESDARALMVSAVFGLHPVNVQAVAWISQRSTLLSALFGFLALILWIHIPSTRRKTLIGIACYALAIFSKESALVYPILLIIIERRWRPKLFSTLFAMTVLFWFWRGHVLGQFSQFADAPRLWGQDLGTGLLALATYVGKLLIPVSLRVSYVWPVWDPIALLGAGMLVLSIVGWIVIAWRKKQEVSLSLIWMGVALLPFLHLIPIRAYVMERALYVPVVGAGWLIATLVMERPSWRILVLGVWGLFCTVQTARALPAWQSDYTLWSWAVRQEPSNAFAWACLAEVEKTPEAAKHAYVQALMHQPSPGVREAAARNLVVIDDYLKRNVQ